MAKRKNRKKRNPRDEQAAAPSSPAGGASGSGSDAVEAQSRLIPDEAPDNDASEPEADDNAPAGENAPEEAPKVKIHVVDNSTEAASVLGREDADAHAPPEGGEENAPRDAKPLLSPDDDDPVEELRRKADEYLEMAQRARADLENFRKRAARDLDQLRQRVQADLLREILNPLDDLDRAVDHAQTEKEIDSLAQGVRMVRDGLWKAVDAAGLERIAASTGTLFDPHVHEAMMQIPHPEIERNHIVEELQPGYKLGETVLRAPKVVVSAGPPDASSE